MSGRKIGRPRVHPEPGPDLAPVNPLAAAQHRRLSQIQRAAYLRKWAPVVAAFVAPFITPPKPPPTEPPKPHVFPPWVTISPRRAVTFVPGDDGTDYHPLPRGRRDDAQATHGYGSPVRRTRFP